MLAKRIDPNISSENQDLAQQIGSALTSGAIHSREDLSQFINSQGVSQQASALTEEILAQFAFGLNLDQPPQEQFWSRLFSANRAFEEDLLCSLANFYADSEIEKELHKTPFDSVDWRYILNLAAFHHLEPLIWFNISQRYSSLLKKIPSKVTKILEKAYQKAATQNQDRQILLTKILAEFNQIDIPVIILKGVSLAYFAYPESSLRPMSDIDLLIPKDFLKSSIKVLQNCAYKIPDYISNIDFYCQKHFHLDFESIEKPHNMLELHWHLHKVFRLLSTDLETVWKNAEEVYLNQQKAYLMSPEEEFLFLCLHLDMHAFYAQLILDQGWDYHWLLQPFCQCRLSWLMDLLVLLHHDKRRPNLKSLLELAQAWKAEEILSRVSHLVQLFFKDQIYPDSKGFLPLCWHHRKILEYFWNKEPKALAPQVNNEAQKNYLPFASLRSQANPEIQKIWILDLLDFIFPEPSQLQSFSKSKNKIFFWIFYFSRAIKIGLENLLNFLKLWYYSQRSK